MPSAKSILIAAAAVAAGVWAFVTTQALIKERFEPIVERCGAVGNYETMDEFVAGTGLHAYDRRVGLVVFDNLVCIITQFLLDLRKQGSAGFLMWGATMLSAIPAEILLLLEAGRGSNRAILKWPTLLSIMSQILGISVVFPLIWVPSYCFFASGSDGLTNATLTKIVVFVSLPMFLMTHPVFTLDTDTDLWTTCAGILGGPLPCIVGIVPWLLQAPKATSKVEAIQIAKSAALSYGIGGAIAVVGWFYLVYTALASYGVDYQAVLKDIWGEDADPCVQFMTVDATILWAAVVLHIASRKLGSSLEALLYTPIFGPGGACCIALASLEMSRAETLSEGKESKKTK